MKSIKDTQKRRLAAARLLAQQFCKGKPYTVGSSDTLCREDQLAHKEFPLIASCFLHTPERGKGLHFYVHFNSVQSSKIEKLTIATDENFDAEGNRIDSPWGVESWRTTSRETVELPKELLDTVCAALDDEFFPLTNLTSLTKVMTRQKAGNFKDLNPAQKQTIFDAQSYAAATVTGDVDYRNFIRIMKGIVTKAEASLA